MRYFYVLFPPSLTHLLTPPIKLLYIPIARLSLHVLCSCQLTLCLTDPMVLLSGELLIRHSLEHAFALLGVKLDVMSSDEQFLRARGEAYDVIIVDPW